MPAIIGNRLRDLAVAVAQEIGPYQSCPVTTTAADGFHAISSAAIDTEAPADRHSGKYLYSHGPSVIREQQRVTRGGFVGATGTFTLAKSCSAAPAAGTLLSLLGTMPWLDQDDLTGLVTCINRSLRKRWCVDRYPITSLGPAVDAYDLGALWWMSERCARRLYGPDPAGTGHAEPASTSWRVRHAGSTWVLELGSGFALGDVFTLEMEQPASAKLYSEQAAQWTYTATPTAGIAADGDACLGTWNDAYQAALYEVYRQLAIQAGGTRKAYWRDRAAEQRLVVATIGLWIRDGIEETAGETGGSRGRGWDPGFGKGLFGSNTRW